MPLRNQIRSHNEAWFPFSRDYTTDRSYIEAGKFGSQTLSYKQITRFGTTRSIPRKAGPCPARIKVVESAVCTRQIPGCVAFIRAKLASLDPALSPTRQSASVCPRVSSVSRKQARYSTRSVQGLNGISRGMLCFCRNRLAPSPTNRRYQSDGNPSKPTKCPCVGGALVTLKIAVPSSTSSNMAT